MSDLTKEPLVYRLRRRAEIRLQIATRKSVQEGKADRIAEILLEAATQIEDLEAKVRRYEYTTCLIHRHPVCNDCSLALGKQRDDAEKQAADLQERLDSICEDCAEKCHHRVGLTE